MTKPTQPLPLFIHVPKTAGSTMFRLLRRQYNWRKVYMAYVEYTGLEYPEEFAYFEQMGAQMQADYNVISGHIPYGAHERLGIPCTYFTLLREPTDRLVSHYYHVRKTPSHYLYEQMHETQISLRDYVQSDMTFELDNGFVRYLAGFETMQKAKVDETDLEKAKINLRDNIVAVGLMERFDESILLLQKRLNWKRPVYYVKRNIGKRPDKSAIDPEIHALARAKNPFDFELYEYGKSLFEEALVAENIKQTQVNLFRAGNQAYGVYYKLRHERRYKKSRKD